MASTGYRGPGQQSNMRGPTGIDGDGGVDYNLVYRSQSTGQQLNFHDLIDKKGVLQQLLFDFRDGKDSVVFDSSKKEEYSKRLMLL